MAETEVTRAERCGMIYQTAIGRWHCVLRIGHQGECSMTTEPMPIEMTLAEVRHQTAKAIAQKLRERAVVLRKKIRQGKFNKGELLAGAIELEIAVKEIEREYEVK